MKKELDLCSEKSNLVELYKKVVMNAKEESKEKSKGWFK